MNPISANENPSAIFVSSHWTPEDKFILKVLFEPEKVKSILPDEAIGTTPPELTPAWTRLVDKAQREGVSAVLFHNIKKHHLEDLIPRASLGNLSNHYYSNLKRNMAIIGNLRGVLAAFQEAGIPCIVLKGIALAEHVYPNIAMRGMADVDILVKKDDLFKADGVLASLGYLSWDSSVAKAIHNPVGYLASLEYRKDAQSPLNLHIHWHTVNTSVPATAFIAGIDLNRLWRNAAETSIADSRALMLRPEHLIIYLCEHALRVGHSFDRLILVCDIYFAIKAFENSLDWAFVTEESRRFGLSRFVYIGLSIVKQYTSLGIPDKCLTYLKPSDMSWGEKLFLSLQLNNRRIRGSSYLIYLAMTRGLFAKLGFITRTLFPPRPILLQRRCGIDHKNLKSYYWSRMREIISHIWESFVPNHDNITR